MVKFTAFLTLLYGLLVLFMGFIGYKTAGSTMSLIMGSGLGAFVVVCSTFMIKAKKMADYIALFFCSLLMVVFIIRYVATQGTMPIVMAVISGLVVACQIIRIFRFVESEDQ